MKALNISMSILLTVCLLLFIVSASISLPIYIRGFYYVQIEPLELEQSSGHTRQEIVDAYNELLDYLTLNHPFGTGVFWYTAEGQSHFEDCKVLFDLNLAILIVSGVVSITLLVLAKLKKITLITVEGHKPYFYVGIVGLIGLVATAILAAVDFKTLFQLFHAVFFAGKDNWLFNSYDNEIITVLPMQFFANCAILIGCFATLCFASCIVVDLVLHKKQKKVYQDTRFSNKQ